MRNLNNYYGNIDLMMGGYMVKPCVCDNYKDRHYIVYKRNHLALKETVGDEVGITSNNHIPEWIPICKIYGYTDKFFELDEINYLVKKWRRWQIMAGKSGICLLDDVYHNPNEVPVSAVAWVVSFVGLDEDYHYEPYKNGYKLMDIEYI